MIDFTGVLLDGSYIEMRDGEKEIAAKLRRELAGKNFENRRNLVVVCSERILNDGRAAYLMNLYKAAEVKELDAIPFWDVFCGNIMQTVQRWVDGSLEKNKEIDDEVTLRTFLKYKPEICASELVQYPEAFLRGMSALKCDLPRPVPWRFCSEEDRLGAEIFDSSPKGRIYWILTQNCDLTRKWNPIKARNTMLTYHKIRTGPDDKRGNGDEKSPLTVTQSPEMRSFYANLQLYRRLMDVKTELLYPGSLTAKPFLPNDFDNEIEKNAAEQVEDIEFEELENDAPLPWIGDSFNDGV